MKNKNLLFAVTCIAICTIAQSQNVFPDSGFVGIGTTDPGAPLELGPDYRLIILGGIHPLGFPTPGSSNFAIGNHNFEESTEDSEGNIAIGEGSQRNNTSGRDNISILGLTKNTTGNYNVAIGSSSAYYLTEGDNNVALGPYALYGSNGTFSQYADENTAVGYNSLYSNGLGNQNVAVGSYALYSNLKGNYNTSLGGYSLDNNVKGNYNTALGYSSDVAGFGYTNATAIGYNAIVNASNKVRIGNSSVSSNGGQVSWTAYSDARIKMKVKENVPGLDFINLLKPVTYHFDVDKQNALMGVSSNERVEGMYDIEKITFTGFLAQDVEAAAKKINYDFSGLDKSGEVLGLRYAEFVVPLVKAVQELSVINEEKESRISVLESENTALKSTTSDLVNRIAKLEKIIAKKGVITQEEVAENSTTQKVSLSGDEAILYQNIPNPFNGQTIIQYFIPETVTNAQIQITNGNGALLKIIEIEKGNGQIELDASKLTAGNYYYSLMIDGKIMDTKQMSLVR